VSGIICGLVIAGLGLDARLASGINKQTGKEEHSSRVEKSWFPQKLDLEDISLFKVLRMRIFVSW